MSANSKTVNVAVIACGMRSFVVMSAFAAASKGKVKILSVFDPDEKVARDYCKKLNIAPKIAASAEEAMDEKGVEWVMIFSPNGCHCDHIKQAFARNKHVFSEKPLATSVEDCLAIEKAHRRHAQCLFATGFVLRYSPVYRKVREILDSGKLGEILSINACENIHPELGSFIMRNWRRNRALSGPYILEKCCHDLDLIMYLSGSLPSKVSGFGSRRFFTAANRGLEKLYDFRKMPDPHAGKTAFSDDGDIFDTQVVAAEMQNGVQALFQSNMCNVIPERRMYISCTKGTLIVELYGGTIRYKTFADAAETQYVFGPAKDGHGGGDEVIASEIYRDVMCGGKVPVCGGKEGLASAVFAMAADRAMLEGSVEHLDDVWKKLKLKRV